MMDIVRSNGNIKRSLCNIDSHDQTKSEKFTEREDDDYSTYTRDEWCSTICEEENVQTYYMVLT